jgi:hypothetical protein
MAPVAGLTAALRGRRWWRLVPGLEHAVVVGAEEGVELDAAVRQEHLDVALAPARAEADERERGEFLELDAAPLAELGVGRHQQAEGVVAQL